MASRFVQFAACGVVALVGVVLAIVIYSERNAPQPGAPQPVAFVPTAPLAAHSDSDRTEAIQRTSDVEETAEAPAAVELPPWPELEARFAEARKKRTKLGDCWDLAQSYNTLAGPASTNSDGYPEHCTRLAEWRREVPESTTALVCLAKAHIEWAWEARGSGWAGTVTQDGWELFSTRIAEARRLLEVAIDKGVEDGQAYASLMTVAMAESVDDEQARAWFDAGQKLDPHYLPLYRSMAVRLMPRWGGEPGDVEKFGAELLQLVPGDDGLEIFGHIALEIHQYECNTPDTLFWGQYDRTLVMKAAELLAERYPNSQPAAHFAAVCALAMQDRAAARRIRPRLGPFSDDHRVWLSKSKYEEFLRWSEAPAPESDESNWMWGSHYRPCGIAFDADSRSVWCGQGAGPRVVAMLDLETHSVRTFLPGPLSYLLRLAVDSEKDWVLASMYGDTFQGWVLWDTSVPIPLLHRTEKRCDAVAIHPTREQVAWVEGSTLKLWDVEKNAAGPTIDLPEACYNIVFSPDGKLIATDCRQDIVWDTATGEKRFELPGGHDKPRREHGATCQSPLAFDEDGSLWAIGSEILQDSPRPGMSYLPTRYSLLRYAPNAESWDVVVEDLNKGGISSPIMPVLSNDRRWLATAEHGLFNGSQGIQLWDVPEQKLARRLSGTWSQVGAMAFSDDSKRLAAISNYGGVIKIWNLDDSPQADDQQRPTENKPE